MRLFKKYKTWLKHINEFFPLRLLKFKKSKWKKLKSFLIKVRHKNSFLSKNVTFLKSKTWLRVKNLYKIKLKYNILRRHRYGFDCKLQSKNLSFEKKFIIENFIRPEYRLDVLLWRLRFFFSIYQARQFLKNGYIEINSKKIYSEHQILNKGDIIKLKNIIFNPNLRLRKEFNFSFLEFDYYTQTIIILKNYNELSDMDIICLLRENYPLYVLKNL